MTKDEALKLALVIDEFDGNDESLPLELLKPIAETLRALAQPDHIVDANKMAQPPLPVQEPLTDDDFEATFKKCGGYWDGDLWVINDADFHPFLRTIIGAKP